MSSAALSEVLKQAELLTRKEQLQLAVRLINKTRRSGISLKWKDICGSVPYPALGEDAQIWISRNRAESDSSREKQWSAA
ncbi:hypothetical protein [Desulfonema magnum]|uniref:Uncharacterized protein n=1 Tax=Desulfonema magnum TaxID=45655 RepID=A0A975BTP6_9BACT|nr:hypothetical protein [Desulfonema magnum]QTA91476.1 Uncharacterized protein dnm_075440 [Desulfonema magnum]